MTRYTKRKNKNETKSNENNLSNTVCFKSGKKLNNNVRVFKHKDYLCGNEVRSGKEEIQSDRLHKEDKNDLEYKETHQIVPVNYNEGPNNILKSTKRKTKLLNCDLCTDSFSSKKSLEHHKKKTHMNKIFMKSRRKGEKGQSEERVLECLREKDNIDEALSSLIEVQTTERVLQRKLDADEMQLNEQEVKVVRSNTIKKEVGKRRMSRKRGNNKKEVNGTLLDDEIGVDHGQSSEKSTCYMNEYNNENRTCFSNFYEATITHDTMLQHRVNKTEEKNLLHSVEKRMTTRSMSRRWTLEESLKNRTSSSSVPHVSEMETARAKSIGNQILNNSKENISEFMFEDCSNKGQLNSVRNETIVQHNFQMVKRFHTKFNNTSLCNLCNSTLFCDKMLKEDKNEDRSTLNVVPQQRKRPQRKSLKLRKNENAAQPALQSNLSMLVDSKLKTNYVSQQIEEENRYEINESIAIGKSTEIICGRRKEEIMKSECHIQVSEKEQQKTCNVTERTYFGRTLRTGDLRDPKVATIQVKNNNERNKSLVKAENLVKNKELVIPLIKLEHLPSSELSKLMRNSNYVENRAIDQREKVYQTSNIVQVQSLVHKQYRNTKIKTKEKICMRNNVIQTCKSQVQEKKRPNSYLRQEIDTHLKSIDLVSIHQYNEERLERQIEGKRSENILSSQMNEKVSVLPLNNEINKTEACESNTSELQTSQLENIANFFLQHKIKNMINKKGNRTQIIRNAEKFKVQGIRKAAAVCSKCKQVFNLLQQFSDKVNFVQDQRLRIECTLCGLQIYSLSHFQQHVMDIHLQCKSISTVAKEKFPVNTLHFNKHLHSNNNKFSFECWCCLLIFRGMKSFQKHVEKMHPNSYYSMNKVENPGEKEVIETSKLHRTFDVTNNTTDTFNQSEENVIQTSDRIDKYYFNTKEINLKNSICYTNSNEVKHSSITHITREISKSKTSIQGLNNEHSDLNKISNISLTTESKFLNVTNVKNNQKDKNRSFLYVCNACPKTYKRKHSFLSHMSMHSISSNTDTNKEQEILEESNIIKLESNAFISNVHAENIQNHFNDHKDNNMVESVPANKYLEESKCNVLQNLTLEEDSKEINNAKNENTKHLAKKENTTAGTDNAFDCNYLLHINFTGKSRRGIKRQKSIKFNINITKKCKTNDAEHEIVSSEIRNKFPFNYIINTDFIRKTNKKEMHCNVCDKRFNSQRVLKEHMFFLHDSIFEGTELSNLLTPYFNDLYNLESVSTQSIAKLREEHNVWSKRNMPGTLIERNKVHEKAISKFFNKNSTIERNRKWRCNACKENFALIRNYLRHKYYYHKDESVVHVCDNCNKVLTSVAMVNIHICTNVNSWDCRRCNLTFANGISLTQHNISNHFETAGPYMCDLCKLNFLTMYMLQRHKFMHSDMDNSSNVTNSVDLSIKDNLPHSLNSTNSSEIELPETEIEPVNDKDITCVNKDTKDSNEASEATKVPLETNTISNVISLPCDDDELFKCKLCNIICLTKIQMKVHLEKWHSIKVEMCQLCNDLYILDEITKHLINHHIILDDSDFKEDNINVQTCEGMKDFQNDIVRILGLKRLLSLYEYQRFDNIPENKSFNCVICVKEFSNVQSYKLHYLKDHDTICLLCNVQFKHSYQAFVHKIKIHTSIDLYLWVIQKIIAAILEFNKHGTTMEDIILQYTEKRSYDEEKRVTNENEHNSIDGFKMKFHEYIWLKDYYEFEKLDANKELLYAIEKFKSSTELSENVNTSIIIIDHSNYKHSSVLNNCELSPQSINKVLS